MSWPKSPRRAKTRSVRRASRLNALVGGNGPSVGAQGQPNSGRRCVHATGFVNTALKRSPQTASLRFLMAGTGRGSGLHVPWLGLGTRLGAWRARTTRTSWPARLSARRAPDPDWWTPSLVTPIPRCDASGQFRATSGASGFDQWRKGLRSRQAPMKSNHIAPSPSSTNGRRNRPQPRMAICPPAASRTWMRSR